MHRRSKPRREPKQQPLELERTIDWLELMGNTAAEEAVLLIHGFGANTNHWRFNQSVLAELLPTYAIDLLGFGRSDQPRARLKDEPVSADAVHYGFDLWGQQVADFCNAVVQRPVLLVGNSIGGAALRAAQLRETAAVALCWSTAPSA